MDFTVDGADSNATYSPGLSERRGSTNKFYHSDALGSTRGTSNSSQTVTGTINYDAFGNTVGSTGSSGNSYMYGANSGYRSDGDAGLSYVAARYYDSKIGRFTTRDSYLDQNPYVYCDGDPVNCLDPSGHDWRTRLRQIGGAIAGKVVGTIIIAGGLLLLPVEAPALIVIGVVIGGGALGGYIGAKIGGFDPTSGAVVGGLTSGLPFLAIPTMLIGPLDILE